MGPSHPLRIECEDNTAVLVLVFGRHVDGPEIELGDTTNGKTKERANATKTKKGKEKERLTKMSTKYELRKRVSYIVRFKSCCHVTYV